MDDRIDFDETTESTVGAVCESIETNLWLAQGYARRDLAGLASDCLRSAWHEYIRFGDVLTAYTGSQTLRDRLVAAMALHGNGTLAGLEQSASLFAESEVCAA